MTDDELDAWTRVRARGIFHYLTPGLMWSIVLAVLIAIFNIIDEFRGYTFIIAVLPFAARLGLWIIRNREYVERRGPDPL